MNTFYTSDTHFFHKNIITFCNRPFATVEEMTEAMIARWNSVVTDEDVVYHLGDFAFGKGQKLRDVFERLRGIKHLIIGNHDGPETLALPWASVSHYHEINDGGFHIVLFHYGVRSWNYMYRGSLMLYGHSHYRLPGFKTPYGGGTLDVGVDCWDFAPVNLKRIISNIEGLPEHTPELSASIST